MGCYYCGERSKKIPLKKNEIALCPRCGSKIYENHSAINYDKALLYALASLILLIPSNLYPILTFELNSIEYSTTFFTSALTLYNQGFGILSLVIFLTAIVFPVLLLLSIVTIVLDKKRFINLEHKKELLKLYSFARKMSFLEIFLLALVVAYIKLIDISTVIIHNNIFLFIGAVIFYILAKQNITITRISILDKNISNSYHISFALATTGLILYVPANFLPIMNISEFGVVTPDTIISGVISLLKSEMYPVALVVFFASVVIPLFKIVGMLYILISIKYKRTVTNNLKLRLYKFIEVIGKWSVLDIYMIALLVALVKEESIAYVEAGSASIFFTLVVFTTMLSTEMFDTKLLWKRYEPS